MQNEDMKQFSGGGATSLTEFSGDIPVLFLVW